MPRRRQTRAPAFTRPAPKLRSWERESNTIYYWQTEKLRICVHRHVDHPPDQWLVTCREAGLDMARLSAKDLVDAQPEAIASVGSALRSALRSLET